MSFRDSSPLRRVGRAVQRWFGPADEPAQVNGAAADGDALLPAIRLADRDTVSLDQALMRAGRLLLLTPVDGNAPLVSEVLSTLHEGAKRWGVVVPAPPAASPVELVNVALAKVGVRLKPAQLDVRLAQGQVIWLVDLLEATEEADVAASLDWLKACLSRYPNSKAVILARALPSHPLVRDFTRASLEPLPWPLARQWLHQHTRDARLALARIGSQPDARGAACASRLFRALLAEPAASGRLSGLYASWLRTLGIDTPAVLADVAALAWDVQTGALSIDADGRLRPPPGIDLAGPVGRLFVQDVGGAWRFSHAALQHDLAAQAQGATAAALRPHAADPAWREVIALWAAAAPEAPALVADLLRETESLSAPGAAEALIPLVLRMVEEMGARGHDLEEAALVGALNALRAEREADGLSTNRARHSPLAAALADHQGIGEASDPTISIVALSRHASPTVRVAAIRALGGSPSEAGLRELRARLADDDPLVAQAASHSLGDMGERALPLLMMSLNDPRSGVRGRAIEALAHLGAPALPPLTEALRSRDPQVVEAAAQTLARLGASGARVLVQALATPAAAQAAVGLKELGQRSPDALVEAAGATNGAVRSRMVELLRQVGEPVRPALIRQLGQAGSSATDLAVDILSETAPHDRAVIAGLAMGLSDIRYPVRLRCENALLRLGPTAVPSMLSAVTDRPDLQGRVIEIAARMQGVNVDGALITALLRVMRTANPEVRVAAVRLLGQAPEAQANESLLDALNDPDPLLRAEAARALAGARSDPVIAGVRSSLEKETAPEARAALIETLARLDLSAVVPIAVTALGDPDDRVRKASLGALRQAGARGVDPLIETVCQSTNPVLRGNAIDLLEDFAGRASTTAEPAYTVARVWHSLLTQRYSASGARERTADLGWWGHGREVYLSYVTAEAFSQFEDIRELEDASRQIYWITEGETWLRPQVQEVLRSLVRLAVQAQAQLSAVDTGARRVGLQTVEARLRDLEDALDATRLDLAPFIDVIRHWRELVRRAIIEASGSADLTIEPITERVCLHGASPVTLAFTLRNVGDGAARAIRVSIDGRAAEAEGLVPNETSWMLPIIEAGQTYRLEFQVRVTDETAASLLFRLRFEDAHRLTQTREVRATLSFYRLNAPYRDIGLNPYIAGPPIRVQEMFFGRKVTLKWIEDQLVGKHGHNVLILFGERRTGKTSVLYQIERLPRFATGEYVFALVDLQQMAYWMDSTAHFYYGLAQRVAEKLQEQGILAPMPTVNDFADMPGPLFDLFLREVIAALGQRTLVIMLDEFDLLLDRFQRGQIDTSVADHIRALIQHQDRLAFIFTGAHAVRAMIEDPKTILFNTAFRRQIGFLQPADARALIEEPVAGLMEFDPLAVDRILDVTHSHPYFIQYMCHVIFERLQNERRNYADLTDVCNAVNDVIQDAMGNIANGYAQLKPEHQLILAALAKVAGEGRRFVNIDEVVQRLEEYNVNLPRRERDRLLEDLKRRDFIEGDPPLSNDRIGFAMDLVRAWLAQRADRELRDLPERIART